MEFTHNGTEYRLERGRATGVWLLVANLKLEGGASWRLVESFDASIYEEDIQDRALVYLKGLD
jgi:hypothetical protein